MKRDLKSYYDKHSEDSTVRMMQRTSSDYIRKKANGQALEKSRDTCVLHSKVPRSREPQNFPATLEEAADNGSSMPVPRFRTPVQEYTSRGGSGSRPLSRSRS